MAKKLLLSFVLASLSVAFLLVGTAESQIGFLPVWGPVCSVSSNVIMPDQWFPPYLIGHIGPDSSGGGGCSLALPWTVGAAPRTPHQFYSTVGTQLRIDFQNSTTGTITSTVKIIVSLKRGIFPTDTVTFYFVSNQNWTSRAFVLDNLSPYDTVRLTFDNVGRDFDNQYYNTVYIDNIQLDQLLPLPTPTATPLPTWTPTGTITATATATPVVTGTVTPQYPQNCPAEPAYQNFSVAQSDMTTWNCPLCTYPSSGTPRAVLTGAGNQIYKDFAPPSLHNAFDVILDHSTTGAIRNSSLAVNYSQQFPINSQRKLFTYTVAQGAKLNNTISFSNAGTANYYYMTISPRSNITRTNNVIRDPNGNAIDWPTWRIYRPPYTSALNYGPRWTYGGTESMYDLQATQGANVLDSYLCTTVNINSQLRPTDTITMSLYYDSGAVTEIANVLADNDSLAIARLVQTDTVVMSSQGIYSIGVNITTTTAISFYIKPASFCLFVDIGNNNARFDDINPYPQNVCPNGNDCALCGTNTILPTVTPTFTPPPATTPTLTPSPTITATIIPSTPQPTVVPTQTPPPYPNTPTPFPTPSTPPTPQPPNNGTYWQADILYIESICYWPLPEINLGGLGIPGLNFHFYGFAICFDFYAINLVLAGHVIPVWAISVAMGVFIFYKQFTKTTP